MVVSLMPLFDFQCKSCGHEFEGLVRGEKLPACPECKGRDLEKLLSLPAVRSDTTRAKAMRAAKQRDQKLGAEREHAQRQYEASHDD
jgi:putative FmdB family regulatory protein